MVWPSVESLQKVVQICYSTEIHEHDIAMLTKNIKTHLQAILDVFNLQLIPKHHLLLHYPQIICDMGPISHMSMLRYEAKHKSLKTFAKRGNNFINITKTIAVRNQAELVYRGFTYCDEINCGRISLTNIAEFSELEKIVVAKMYDTNEMVCEIEWFKCNNLTFRKGFVILHQNHLHEIGKILVSGDKYYMLCSSFEFLAFVSFTHSLIVQKMSPINIKLILFDELDVKKPYNVKCIDEKFYVFADTLDVHKAM